MPTITQRELRNNSAAIMDRVEAGETLTVTRNGQRVAELRPLIGPRTAIPSHELLDALKGLPAMSYEQLVAEADTFLV